MIREMGPGLPFSPPAPAVLGMDFAGVIEAVGDGVNEYQVGDEVYGCAGGLGGLPGTLAEYMVADARLIAHKPKNYPCNKLPPYHWLVSQRTRVLIELA